MLSSFSRRVLFAERLQNKTFTNMDINNDLCIECASVHCWESCGYLLVSSVINAFLFCYIFIPYCMFCFIMFFIAFPGMLSIAFLFTISKHFFSLFLCPLSFRIRSYHSCWPL
ncbi:hypothetical protein L873DRAFT_1156502 [Choiromyces venosus 120613-1]|uniref:Uncharacterized protein n=1 Tax=Choiromyces venosus 120613-1 TaxID=1336337 RepID=A0A3N4JTL9_9PEZI|nr:hypothetical protein L873DRAFT_1156502 [Choiromyces venosus 120613-1]